MDRHVSELVQALADVRDRLGERAYREALFLALHGVNVAIQMEGERRLAEKAAPVPAEGGAVVVPLRPRGGGRHG